LYIYVYKRIDCGKKKKIIREYKLSFLPNSDVFVQGVKSTVEEIENRKIHLDELCTAHREENVRLSQAFTAFLEKQNEVSCNNAEYILLFEFH
jgi:hypothetical protein